MKNKIGLIILATLMLNASIGAKKNEFGASQPEESFVKDSTLTEDKYSRGVYYNVNLGTKTRTKEVDPETGLILLKDQNGNIIKAGQDNNLSEIYRDALNQSMYRTDEKGHQ